MKNEREILDAASSTSKTYLQRNVLKPLQNKLLPVSKTYRSLQIAHNLSKVAYLQALSFPLLKETGNLHNTKSFMVFSLLLSRLFFWCEPSVLLLASSSLLKEKGSNFKAHKCLSFSFPNLLGVFQVFISSSRMFCMVLGTFAGVQFGLVSWSGSSHCMFRVSRLIVVRSGTRSSSDRRSGHLYRHHLHK